MKYISICVLFAITILLPISSSLSASESPKGIVVWRLEAKKGVSEKVIDSISGIIATEIEKASGLKVVSEADIATILKGEEIKQKCTGDSDTSCVAEIGAALGVPEAVSGDLGRLGNIWVLNLRRIQVRKAEVIKRVTRQVEGKIDNLVKAVPGAVAELFDVPKTPEEQAKADSKTFQIAGWTLFGTGLGFIVLGGVGHGMMKDARGNDRSSFDAWKGVAISGYVIGGAAVATGAALLFVDTFRPKPKGEPNVTVGVAPASGGFMVGIGFGW